MLQTRCVQRLSRHSLGPARCDRKFSSRAWRPNLINRVLEESNHHSRHSVPSPPCHRFRQARSPTIRFASTSTHSLPVADVQSTFSPVTTDQKEDHFSLASLDEIVENQNHVGDHLGFLKELGLDYGWGPTAFVQTLLEHVYIYTGLPWWASLVSTILIIRVGMLKFYIDANDMSARSAVIAPIMKPIMARYKEATRNKDKEAAVKAFAERKAVNASAGIYLRKSLMPLLQIPLGFGTFRLLNGMSSLPVPGLDIGGVLWFKDLTVSDPSGILPIMTGLTFFYTFKLGGETGGAGSMSPAVKTVFLYLLPTVTTCFSLFWPAGLQLTIFCTGVVTVLQAIAFKQAWVRKFLGMHPLPSAIKKRSPDSPAGTPIQSGNVKRRGIAGALDTLKEAWSDLAKQGQAFAGESTSSSQTIHRTGAESNRANLREVDKQRAAMKASQAKKREQESQREAAQRRFEHAQAEESKTEHGRVRKIKHR